MKLGEDGRAKYKQVGAFVPEGGLCQAALPSPAGSLPRFSIFNPELWEIPTWGGHTPAGLTVGVGVVGLCLQGWRGHATVGLSR